MQAIEAEANGIEQSNADQKLKAITAELESLKALADVKITVDMTPAEIADAQAKMQALAAILSKSLVVTPTIALGDASGGQQDPYKGAQGFATGGRVRGPGTGTSDSIMARLSNGEFVMRAAAVRAYGPALLEKMNGLRIPKFADGGLVGAAMSAPVGQSGRDLGRVDLNLPGGETISLLADQQSFTELLKRQSWKRGSTRR